MRIQNNFQGAVNPSEGSKRGQMFIGATGVKTPNMGQLAPKMIVESGQEASLTFQAGKVRKPFVAVSAVNEKGNLVIFDGDNSFIVPGNSKEVPQLRKLINTIPKKIRLHKKNGVFTMKTWQRPTSPFQGQGW